MIKCNYPKTSTTINKMTHDSASPLELFKNQKLISVFSNKEPKNFNNIKLTKPPALKILEDIKKEEIFENCKSNEENFTGSNLTSQMVTKNNFFITPKFIHKGPYNDIENENELFQERLQFKSINQNKSNDINYRKKKILKLNFTKTLPLKANKVDDNIRNYCRLSTESMISNELDKENLLTFTKPANSTRETKNCISNLKRLTLNTINSPYPSIKKINNTQKEQNFQQDLYFSNINKYCKIQRNKKYLEYVNTSKSGEGKLPPIKYKLFNIYSNFNLSSERKDFGDSISFINKSYKKAFNSNKVLMNFNESTTGLKNKHIPDCTYYSSPIILKKAKNSSNKSNNGGIKNLILFTAKEFY